MSCSHATHHLAVLILTWAEQNRGYRCFRKDKSEALRSARTYSGSQHDQVSGPRIKTRPLTPLGCINSSKS